jgi:hypothetical protein
MAVYTLEDLERLAIVALFSEPNLRQALVLKGGNLLDVVYGISDPLDRAACGTTRTTVTTVPSNLPLTAPIQKRRVCETIARLLGQGCSVRR